MKEHSLSGSVGSRRERIANLARALLLLAVTICLTGLASGQVSASPTTHATPSSFGNFSDRPPNEEAYLYHALPDIAIRTLQGNTTLAALWREKPLLLTLVFTRCANICSPFLESLQQATQSVKAEGKDYRVLVLSFDPRDTLDDLRDTAKRLHWDSHPGWIFGIATQKDTQRLASSFGFWYRWDAKAFQYDHPSLLVGVDRRGRIARMLVGATVPRERLLEVVEELKGNFVASYPLPGSKVVFRCFAYDPSGGVHFSWGFLIMMLPGTVAIGVAAVTFCVFPRRADSPL